MATDTVKVKVHGIPLEVEFDYAPPERGSREKWSGAPLEPDYPEEIDITEVRLAGYEILCLMSDDAVVETRDAILKMER